MSRDNATTNKYKEKLIKFKPDETNLNIKTFSINNNVIVAHPHNNHSILNHFEPLSKSGIFYYQVRILKTHGKNLIFGVCTN